MNKWIDVDVLIVGAGPAGLTAALRLLQLGYCVAIVDKQSLPRPNIGESLTPGIANILDTLGAREILSRVPNCAGLPTRRLWASRDQELHRNDGAMHVMVERGQFDLSLLQLAEYRGAKCFLPARMLSVEGVAGAWRIRIGTPDTCTHLCARYLLDAQGRRSTRDTLGLAPPLLALWSEFPGDILPTETQIEATQDSWLWSSPLPNGTHRVMAFCDPRAPTEQRESTPGHKLSACFHQTLKQSQLFSNIANASSLSPLKGCAATPYVSANCWQPGRLKLGDAAFAVDPLSSSGVEKAMRFSLQAMTALHTVLSCPADENLARDFFDTRLHETVARHAMWTESFYAQAWPAETHKFWQLRAREFTAPDLDLGAKLRARVAAARKQQRPASDGGSVDMEFLRVVLRAPMQLAPELEFVELACAVADRVQRRMAVRHPKLVRPVAFLEQLEVVPLLASIVSAASLGEWMDLSSCCMPRQKAMRIAGWLLQHGLIINSVGASVVHHLDRFSHSARAES